VQQVGPYQISGELGRGGMGVVYRARREGAHADVALKVIAAGADASPEALARFQREARIATELDHPGIVKVLETGQDGDTVWFAMELIEGEPLSTAILKREFTWQEAVTIVRDIADALSLAHDKGVLHRDLKPSNIILDPAGNPHVTDFGLAKDTRTESKYTRSGQTLGTPAYMSPEQARGDLADLTPASDVWALGCVLYELMLNRLAFEGDTPAAIIGAVMSTTPDTAMLPRHVARLANVCLQRDARRRYQDAGALRDDCDRVLMGQSPVAKLPSRLGRNLAIAAVAAIAMGGLGALAWMGDAAEQATKESVEAAGPTEAERIADRAWGLRHADPSGGVELFQTALTKDPARPQWRVRLGLLLWAIGRQPEARDAWGEVPPDADLYPKAMLYSGLATFFNTKDGRLQGAPALSFFERAAGAPGRVGVIARAGREAALGHYEKARKQLDGADGWEAHLMRAVVFDQLPNEPESASAEQYDRGIEAGIPFAWAFLNRGASRNNLGRHADSIVDFDAAAPFLGHRAELWHGRGTALFHLKRYEEAIADLSKAITIDPTLTLSYSNRAGCLVALKRNAEAERDLQLVIERAPEEPVAWYYLGYLRKRQGDFPAAVRFFTRSLKFEPGRFESLRDRARAYLALRQAEPALQDLAAALELRPHDVELRVDRGGLHENFGRHAEALADLDVALTHAPDHPTGLYYRGAALGSLKRPAEAIADLDRLLKVDPKHRAGREMRASLLQSSGRFAEAAHDYEALIEAWPNDVMLVGRLGRVREQGGDWAGAIEAYERFLRRAPTPKLKDYVRSSIERCRNALKSSGK
jgi:tetratricopeptide (TPR) repeat protein/predicted Ser/Thr protein kinase